MLAGPGEGRATAHTAWLEVAVSAGAQAELAVKRSVWERSEIRRGTEEENAKDLPGAQSSGYFSRPRPMDTLRPPLETELRWRRQTKHQVNSLMQTWKAMAKEAYHLQRAPEQVLETLLPLLGQNRMQPMKLHEKEHPPLLQWLLPARSTLALHPWSAKPLK